MAQNQWLNQAANISINYSGTVAYVHLPPQGMYNVYFNKNSSNTFQNKPNLWFNLNEIPIKFDKVQDWNNLFSGCSNLRNIGNGIVLCSNPIWAYGTLAGCPNAYGDIYINLNDSYYGSRAVMMGRYGYSSVNKNIVNAYYGLGRYSFLASGNNYIYTTGTRSSYINVHVQPGSMVNNWFYSYYATSFNGSSNSSYSKMSWSTITNGYYSSTYKLNIYYNNPHVLDVSSLSDVSNLYYGAVQHPSMSLLNSSNFTNISRMYSYGYSYNGSYISPIPAGINPVCGSNVVDMSGAYNYQMLMNRSPVCGPNVVNMANAYYYCYNMRGSAVCGSKVEDMSGAYYYCPNLTGSPACGPNVTNMFHAYYSCSNLTGSPVCGPNVVNMCNAYRSCSNLRGSPVCGDNVIDMYGAYIGCSNLTGSAACGPNVVNMSYAYSSCYNLTGSAACGPNVVNMSNAYNYCNNLTGSAACGPNVVNMSNAYNACYKLTGSANIGPNVINLVNAYRNCWNLTNFVGNALSVTNAAHAFFNCNNLTGNLYLQTTDKYFTYPTYNSYYMLNGVNQRVNIYVCRGSGWDIGIRQMLLGYDPGWINMADGNGYYYNNFYVFNNAEVIGEGFDVTKLVNATNAYFGCSLMRGNPVCGEVTTTMYGMYQSCSNLTGSPVCGNNVTSMSYAYQYCRNLTGSPVCGPNVTSLVYAYQYCNNLTGSPVCGNNVTNILYAYSYCYNLTGSPVCTDKIVNMSYAYQYCSNLTGSPVCGPNVVNMSYAYQYCRKLTGSPVCSSVVNNMAYAYQYCSNLTGAPVLGINTINIAGAYNNCYNITGTVYWNYSGSAYYNSSNTTARNYNIMYNTSGAFYRDASIISGKRINCWISNTVVFNVLKNLTNYYSLVGRSVTWTTYNTYFFYNTEANIYVYTSTAYPTYNYSVSVTGTGNNCLINGSSSYSNSSLYTNKTLSLPITADNVAWVVPTLSRITVLGSEYTYTVTNQEYATLSLFNMAPRVIINARATIKQYTVTINTSDMLINSGTSYSFTLEEGQTETVALSASGDFKLPLSISLSNLTCDYTRTSDTEGTLVISHPLGDNIAINRTITAEIKRADISVTLTNCTADVSNDTECYDNENVLLTYYFDGVSYKCPSVVAFNSYGSCTGSSYNWTRVSDTEGILEVFAPSLHTITITLSGVPMAYKAIQITAYGEDRWGSWYNLNVYDSPDGTTYGTLLSSVSGDGTPTIVETIGSFIMLETDARYTESMSCNYISGGISKYNNSDWSYILTGDGVLSVSYYTSCFLPGTMITMFDGTRRPVEEIEYGDLLKVWNFNTGQYDIAPVIWLTKDNLMNDHYYKLTLADGTILKTTGKNSNHRVYNVDKCKFEGVAYIEVGQHIFTENGVQEIIDKEYIEEEVFYYNLITSYHFNCFANGVLTSDRFGNMYKIDENMKFILEERPDKPYSDFEERGIKEYWYRHFRLWEQSDTVDSLVDYIQKCQSQMRPIPKDKQEDLGWK